jgi:hypothetical protein
MRTLSSLVAVVSLFVAFASLAVRAEPRPCRVQLLGVGEDLDPPLRRVAGDLAPAARDEHRLAQRARPARAQGAGSAMTRPCQVTGPTMPSTSKPFHSW